MSRSISHVRETASRDMVRSKIDNFYSNGDALVREWSERDYGVDFVLELFENGNPTGKIAFLQIKGTANPIEKLKNSDEVSCHNVSLSSLEYAYQRRIPFILIYASIAEPKCFYYVDLQSAIKQISLKEDRKSSDITIRIPLENMVKDDLSGFFNLINSFFEAS